jgi:enoyl-CoA hydratase
MGSYHRVVPAGESSPAAIAQWDLDMPHALHQEWQRGKACIGQGLEGAARFAAGSGRHGKFQ